ncbi:MAG: hypothetical protein ACI9TI_001397 [Natronomonas sp.]|jgi:hypothetical protein|uniref:DUF1641 domain-containing protein n=1 Tax=Natronomonas sp. TaxID=2184060 RepID=UPI003989E85B
MSDASEPVGEIPAEDDEGVDRLRARVEANADDLAELLDLLVAIQGLSEDITPELRTAAAEHREPLAELRTSLEREEMLVLAERVGENAEDLAELLDLLSVTRDLAADLTPELRAVAVEQRGELEALRLAFEREETLTLLRRLGHNTDTFLDLLAVLEVTSETLADLAPSEDAEAAALSADIERLAAAFDRETTVATAERLGENMETLHGLVALLEGFGESAGRTTAEYYELGRRLGGAAETADRVADPAVLETVEAGAGAVAENSDRQVGILGLLSALRNDDVQRTLGTVVEAAERVGATRRAEGEDE